MMNLYRVRGSAPRSLAFVTRGSAIQHMLIMDVLPRNGLSELVCTSGSLIFHWPGVTFLLDLSFMPSEVSYHVYTTYTSWHNYRQ